MYSADIWRGSRLFMQGITEYSMGKVLVGVTARRGDEGWVQEHSRHYLSVLNGYGATPIVLSPDTPVTLPDGSTFAPDDHGRLPADVLPLLDGLVLSGGGDVDPAYFGAQLAGANPKAIDRKRDELELTLARQAFELDLPTFGICRGCQVMNVAAGGGMVQDFDGHRSPKDEPFYHPVVVDRTSKLHALVADAEIPVNTYHHQGVDLPTLAPGLRASAMARPDAWLIEALESPDHRWMVGVQWHPERLFELSEAHRRLWDGFVRACDRTRGMG